MSDVAGRIMLPGDLKALDDRARNGFVSQLRDLSKLLSYQPEGHAAEMVAKSFLVAGVIDESISNLSNEKAIELVNEVANQIETDPAERFAAGALFDDGTLAALVFDVTDGSSQFLKLTVNVPRDTTAGDIFAGLMIESAMNKLATEKGASVCWSLVEHFCNIKVM